MSTVSFTVKELQDTLSLISGAKSKRATLEILSHFLLTTSNGVATFYMTNLDVAASCSISSDADEDMSVAIPFQRFSQLISSRKGVDKPIKIVRGLDKNDREIITIKQGRWKAQIKTMPASEFPLENDSQIENAVVLDVNELRDTIQDTVFCTATDFTRPVLQGVHITSGDTLSFEATDGFRLARKEIEVKIDGYDCVVSADTLRALLPLLKKSDSITMGINKNTISFSGDSWQIKGQLIASVYPDTSTLLNMPSVIEFSINADDIKMSLSGAAAFEAAEIDFIYKDGVLNVSMENDYGKVDDNIEVDGNSVDVEFKLNPRYISPILNRRETLTIKTDGIAKPVFLVSETSFWLIMPLHRG